MNRFGFDTFFGEATDYSPYDYQRRLACGERKGCSEAEWLKSGATPESQLINIPTGLGKTAAVALAWLWNRVHLQNPDWPRRLVYCLPMRTLVEQTDAEVKKWLTAHKLLWDGNPANRAGKVGVHILMGGEDAGEWDIYPEESAILIGTQDMLLSRALNRGYGMSRHRWPMHFGLLNNDCLWVMDETQLMGVGVETSAQLDAFQRSFNTFGTRVTWWMSATIEATRLATVDHPLPRQGGFPLLSLGQGDLAQDNVKARVRAKKNLAPCEIGLTAATKDDYPRQLAEWISKQHQPGSLTLVVVNNVARAQDVCSRLEKLKLSEPIGLIHSRFRPGDREKHEALLRAEGGRIIIATQAVEAGVDVSARTLITELAPWSSLVQRFGRCNRCGEFKGDQARVYWINIETKGEKNALAGPYQPEELERARNALKDLENVGPENLQSIQEPSVIRLVIRRKDILELFDTTPDLAGHDLDISRYIRDGDDTDVQVFWRDLDGKAPASDAPKPAREELCRVSRLRFQEFLDKLRKAESKASATKLRAYVWNQLLEKWDETRTARAGATYLLDTKSGGYSVKLGWFGGAKFEPDVFELAQEDRSGDDSYSGNQSSFQRVWVKLSDHTQHVGTESHKLVSLLTGEFADALMTAALWHDIGKVHPVFQRMLTQGDSQRGTQLWAKSENAMTRCERRFFRHELASALAWLQAGPSNAPERDLIAYLIAAHHGKVRLSIRSLPGESVPDLPALPDKSERLFARGIWHQHKDDSEKHDVLPPVALNGLSLPEIPLDLNLMQMGEGPHGSSWLARMLALRDRLGPFRLAYLETLLRAADMRASAAESGTMERIL